MSDMKIGRIEFNPVLSNDDNLVKLIPDDVFSVKPGPAPLDLEALARETVANSIASCPNEATEIQWAQHLAQHVLAALRRVQEAGR